MWFWYSFLILICLLPSASFAGEQALITPDIEAVFNEFSPEEIDQALCSIDSNPEFVVKCEFTCKTPIVRCGDWTPPPGRYSTDLWATAANAKLACQATAESICRRCTGDGLASFWYTLYRSVRWVCDRTQSAE